MGNNLSGLRKRKQGRISVHQIEPNLPIEIWQIIFDSMPICDKFFSSKVFIEFGQFYFQLLKNFEKYAVDLRDDEVEKSALAGLNPQPHDSVDGLQTPSISFSIHLSKRSMAHPDPNPYLTFKNDDKFLGNDRYSTYLNVVFSYDIDFVVKELCLPTGKFNIFYKVRGPCRVHNEFKVTVKHSLPIQDDIGYLNIRQLKRLELEWDWAPVYKDQDFKELLEVSYNFESRDLLDVELFNYFPSMSRNISFHVIRFALA